MWTRAELKERAKIAFKANYWKCVAMAIILGIVSAAGSSGGRISNSDRTQRVGEILSGLSRGELLAVFGIVTGVLFVALIIGILIKIFIKNPVSVACYKFYIENTEQPAGFDVFGKIFKSGSALNIFAVMFMRDLIISLFSLLFVVPGIIKSYQYRMIPYILAENPSIGWKEALAESKRMMDGQKMNAFILDLSFIGWVILGIITLGLGLIFYVDPYVRATDAELYKVLKNK